MLRRGQNDLHLPAAGREDSGDSTALGRALWRLARHSHIDVSFHQGTFPTLSGLARGQLWVQLPRSSLLHPWVWAGPRHPHTPLLACPTPQQSRVIVAAPLVLSRSGHSPHPAVGLPHLAAARTLDH